MSNNVVQSSKLQVNESLKINPYMLTYKKKLFKYCFNLVDVHVVKMFSVKFVYSKFAWDANLTGLTHCSAEFVYKALSEENNTLTATTKEMRREENRPGCS